MSAASATAEVATPAIAARERLGAKRRPTTAAIDTMALSKNKGPSQRTPCITTAYCWTWTAASPASATAPSKYAVTVTPLNATTAGAGGVLLLTVRRDGRAGVLVAITASAHCSPRRLVARSGDRGPHAAELVDALA